MKKKITILFLFLFFGLSVFTQNLYRIELKANTNQSFYFQNPGFKVHYFNDNFIIGSGILPETADNRIIEKAPLEKAKDFVLIFLPQENRENYISEVKQYAEVLYETGDYMICKQTNENTGKYGPAIHGGIIKINLNSDCSSPKSNQFSKDFNPVIEGYVSEVVGDSILLDIQHMEDYVTRRYDTPQAILAQNWIKNIFENYGLTVELTNTGAGGSMNVTAYQTGLVYPDRYIIIGGHYDSYTYSGAEPGADDNASGTAGVMEVARILSQYQFNYSIIYSAWSAEEIGLYGSDAWVTEAANNNMDIIGYLNLDMIGYLNPGDDFKACMIAPASAQDMIDLYYTVVDQYVTDFTVYNGSLSGGDSDHTSFNNNGYQGIFPFEDCTNYSPYIHTSEDLIGLSVNSIEKAVKFTEASVAFIATAAELFTGLYPPMNLVLTQLEDGIQLDWDEPLNPPKNFVQYNIYRNDVILSNIIDIGITTYTDNDVENGVTYEYYVTAVYDGDPSGESGPTNKESVTQGLNQIQLWDFEDGVQSWTIMNTTMGWQWGVPVSISGNNTEYLSINSDAAGSGNHVFDYAISPEIDMTNYLIAFLDFDYGFNQYSSDFLKVMYRTGPGSDWVEITNLPESGSFTHNSIELPQEAMTEAMQLAFYYDDNSVWAWYAAVDNVEITAANEPTIGISDVETVSMSIYPNPVNSSVMLSFDLPQASDVTVIVIDGLGKAVIQPMFFEASKGMNHYQMNTEHLKSGLYFILLETANGIFTQKLFIVK